MQAHKLGFFAKKTEQNEQINSFISGKMFKSINLLTVIVFSLKTESQVVV